MEKLTFNDLPEAVTRLSNEIGEIKRLLLEKNNPPQPPADELLTVQDAAKFLNLQVQTVYGLISKGDLPVMKRSKRCYFSKLELMQYLKEGRRKTNEEIEKEAKEHLLNRKAKK